MTYQNNQYKYKDDSPLSGNRLFARAVEPEDATSMWEMESDPGQWQYNGMTAPLSILNLRAYANNYEADPYQAGQIRFIVEQKIPEKDEWENKIVGMVDLYDISTVNRTAYVGIYVRPKFRGNGFGLEMAGIIACYARRMLNLHSLVAKVTAGNVASQKLFLKAGYSSAGCLKEWVEWNRERKDMLIYQIILK